MPDDYKHYGVKTTMMAQRPGWRGVWDHFYARLRKRPTPLIETEVHLSVYATEPVTLNIWGMQVEECPKTHEIKDITWGVR